MNPVSVPTAPKDVFSQNTSITQEEILAYDHDYTEYVPFKGILVYIKDVKYPKKGFPTPEAVFAIGQMKALIRETIKYAPNLLFADKNRLIQSFNTLAYKSLYPYLIKEIYLCPAAYHTHLFVYQLLTALNINQQQAFNFSINIAHIVEYDDAYRYRLQDIVTELNVASFQENPRKETKRLFTIFQDRTTDFVAEKFVPFVNLLLKVLLIPMYGKAFKRAIPHLKGAAYDEGDLFWIHTRGDHYNFLGQTPEERQGKVEMPKIYPITIER